MRKQRIVAIILYVICLIPIIFVIVDGIYYGNHGLEVGIGSSRVIYGIDAFFSNTILWIWVGWPIIILQFILFSIATIFMIKSVLLKRKTE